MQTIIIQILILTLAVILTSYLLPGITVKSFWTALLVAIVLALLNTFLKPLILFLTIPFTIMTFGLFVLVINALIIMLAGSLIRGFEVRGFWWAMLFSVILTIIQYLLEYLILPLF
jgi:putative membrane protein